MARNKEKDAVVELLSALSDGGDRANDKQPVSEQRRVLARAYPPTTRDALKGIFSKADALDLRQERAFIYCPTVSEAGHPLLPILTVNAQFTGDDSSFISVYVMCWVYANRKWYVLPLRFERPSKAEMSGAHGYNHAQFFWSLKNDGIQLVNGDHIKWLPDKLPAIPLPQRPSVVSVLASAVVSLYGADASRYIHSLEPADWPLAVPKATAAKSRKKSAKPSR